MTQESELTCLLRLSARIGQNPMLIQASNGNTSLKTGGVLWIKASGKWLADAMMRERNGEMLVPIQLGGVLESIQQGRDPECMEAQGASMETPMHAVLPYRVVVHTHSTNAIAWGVRVDGEERVAGRLTGLPWVWVPYSPSGTPLALAVAAGLARSPGARIFLLANHGIVYCGDDCASTEALLDKVEERLALEPRATADDPVSRRILAEGILYPCQAIFLEREDWLSDSRDDGRAMSRVQRMMLTALSEVVRRIPEDAPIRYLTGTEVQSLGNPDAHRYRQNAENYEMASAAN